MFCRVNMKSIFALKYLIISYLIKVLVSVSLLSREFWRNIQNRLLTLKSEIYCGICKISFSPALSLPPTLLSESPSSSSLYLKVEFTKLEIETVSNYSPFFPSGSTALEAEIFSTRAAWSLTAPSKSFTSILRFSILPSSSLTWRNIILLSPRILSPHLISDVVNSSLQCFSVLLRNIIFVGSWNHDIQYHLLNWG